MIKRCQEEPCDSLYYCTTDGDKVAATGKPLQKYCYYCLNTPRTKKIGHASMWSGSAPAWCPKRQGDVRKENAHDLLPKFVSANGYSSRIHDNNGTLVACNGYIAAVIRPENVPEWDLNGAYMMKDGGEKWTAIQAGLQGCRALSRICVGADTLRKLYAACEAAIGECRKRTELKKAGPVYMCVDTGKMEAITESQASDMYAASSGHPMGFDAGYLETVLGFILCADAETEIYYSTHLTPLYLHAGNLYTVLNPVRMKWGY